MSEGSRRRGLGRGLDALIVNTGDQQPDAATDTTLEGGENGGRERHVRMLSAGSIQPNPHQPRSHFDDDSLAELAASIRTHGIIQPLLVTASPQRPDLYWLIAGERRWRAAQMAGLESIPAIVREANAQSLVELALIENVQRADLHALEEAAAYASLMSDFGMTQAEVAERVGKSRSAVANMVRLLQLPAIVQAVLLQGSISPGHARALLPLETEDRIESALQMVMARDLNVRETETLVKKLLQEDAQPKAAQRTSVSDAEQAQAAHFEEGFRRALGTRVALTRSGTGAGKLIVHFYSDDDLEAIYRTITGEAIQE